MKKNIKRFFVGIAAAVMCASSMTGVLSASAASMTGVLSKDAVSMTGVLSTDEGSLKRINNPSYQVISLYSRINGIYDLTTNNLLLGSSKYFINTTQIKNILKQLNLRKGDLVIFTYEKQRVKLYITIEQSVQWNFDIVRPFDPSVYIPPIKRPIERDLVKYAGSDGLIEVYYNN